jgi:UDPglucose--hexose-1-phosphate uridylyltransferase
LTEVRRHLITGDPILYAPHRAARPRGDSGICPFCPGNEHETPPEVARVGEPWRVRVFPNKFPIAEPHEVIVETSEHDATFASIAHAPDVVATYIERYRALRPFGTVALFKNQGAMAGASLSHMHSQIAALPFVPPRIAREAEAFAKAADCPLCQVWRRQSCRRSEPETPAGLPAPHENDSFVMIDPHARMFSGERWIIPKAHIQEISDVDAPEDLAAMLQLAARETPGACNWLFFNYAGVPRAHFYIAIAPRVSTVAGLELETGTFVDSE